MGTNKFIAGPGREIDPAVMEKDGTVLLESIQKDEENAYSYLFQDPAAVIQCMTSRMVPCAIDQIQESTRKGMYAAGFLGYEAGAAWIPGCDPTISGNFPLLWFGLYDTVERFDSPLLLPATDHFAEPIDHALNVSKDDYQDSVGKILQLIRDGETYQVNYTVRTQFYWTHGAWQLYLRLRRSQPVPYGAYLNCGKFNLVSLAPELFLFKKGKTLLTRPMKGTAPRGNDSGLDEQMSKWLKNDPKNLAENLMIVDLMRNDLGRLAKIGSVGVQDPFRVEPFSGLFQMTSGVKCTLRDEVSLSEIFESTFPPGSVTGAPKINTMKIISQLESTPRNAYTGAIGSIDPGGDMNMSVAIRTVICSASGRCEMGIGSGIVSDSVPEDEYKEIYLKADFLNTSPGRRTDLFETILLQENGTLVWYEEHLDRMESSARFLGYPFSREKAKALVAKRLGDRARGLAIVRLILVMNGDIHVHVLPYTPVKAGPKRVILSRCRTDPVNILLRHKTTLRHIYDRELAKARDKGYIETLFTNVHGYITEGAITNLFVFGAFTGGDPARKIPEGGNSDLKGSIWVTPGIQNGLLPGIWRRKFIESSGAVEIMIRPAELGNATRIIIGNSVRGAMEVDEIMDADGALIFRKSGIAGR